MASARLPRIRHQLFLGEDLSARLEALAAKPGASKSAILADALTAWLNRQAASELENKFGQRLDRLSMALGRVERDGHVLLESLALFIRYELMVQAPLAEGRSEEHTSELQSLMRISYAVFCLKKKKKKNTTK